MSGKKQADGSGSFYKFVELCKEIEGESSHKGKTQITKNFLDGFNGNVYLVFKLILPKGDNRVFRVKDKNIVKIFSAILCCDLDEMMDHLDKGDVSETIKYYLKKTDSTAKRSYITLKQVDDFLDKLTTITKREHQEEAFEKFCLDKKFTGDEIKFLIRRICGDLKIYAGEKILLEALHPDAYKAWTLSHDIKSVVDRCTGDATQSQTLNSSLVDFDLDALINSDEDMEEDDKQKDKKEKKDKNSKEKKANKQNKDSSDEEKETKKKTNKQDKDSDEEKEIKKKPAKASSSKNKDSESDDETDIDVDLGELDKPISLAEADSDDDSSKKKGNLLNPSSTSHIVSEKKKDKKIKLQIKMKLGVAVKPMLARPSKSFDDAIKRCPNGFYTELKYDGERIQIHFDRKSDKPLQCYSRNLKPVMEYKVKDVQEFIKKSIKPHINKVILDGEILLIDNTTSKPLPFGTLGKHKKNQQTNASICIFLFDILYYEGKSLLEVPLYKRRKLLTKSIKVIPHRILLGEAFVCNGSKGDRETLLANKMRAVIEQGEEGLVLKDLNSIYEPNARHWLKIKKDYLKGMADSADLLVLGAYFGTGSKSGLLSVYLMGVHDKSTNTYKTVCKCGNGHNDEAIERLDTQLRKKMKKISRDYDSLPDWLNVERSIVPDFIIRDPKNTVVWEVSGAEFTKTDHHTSEYSIRFPRVTKIRDDKEVEDATDLDHLKYLVKQSKKKASVAFQDNVTLNPGVTQKNNLSNKGKKRKKDEDEDDEDEKQQSNSDDDDDDGFIVPDDQIEEEEEEEEKNDKKKKNDGDHDIDEEITPIHSTPGKLSYVYGDLSKTTNHDGHRILAHVVDNSGSWSNFGAMKTLTDMYDKKPKSLYTDSGELKLGKIQTCKLSKKAPFVLLCNMIAQEYKHKGEPRVMSHKHFDECARAIARLIKSESRELEQDISLHFSRIHRGTLKLKWDQVHDSLQRYLVDKGINVTVYTKDRDDENRIKDSNQPTNNPQQQQSDGQLFKKVYAVISGYSQQETESIQDHLLKNGGHVSDEWKIVGADRSTVLVCESKTSTYDHVNQLTDTVIVKSAWVDDCLKQDKILPYDSYLYNEGSNNVTSDEEEEQVEEPKKKKQKKQDSDEESEKKALLSGTSMLMDFFDSCVVYLYGDVDEKRQVVRYLIAHGADVISEFDDENITHVVTDKKKWDDGLKELKKKGAKVVNSSWVWQSVNSGSIAKESLFFLK
ncbi:ligase [Acrasis kona]|uniref:DNA ligase n=1 Tax=Acrasis kona TaxID=1008807 RepID=A0AAW2YZW0_9EUKA